MHDQTLEADRDDHAPPIERARTAFIDCFGRTPGLLAVAPGRVNLIGEHTDYNEGAVLPIAIDRHTVVVAARAKGQTSRLAALDLAETAALDLAEAHAGAATWIRLAAAVVGELTRTGEAPPALDLLITSDVPIGGGLSSSAALGVALTTLFARAADRRLGPLETARLCRRAEHAATGVRCGIMDMYASARGEAGHALAIDCRTETARAIPMPAPAALTVLVVDTGVRRRLTAGVYEDRRRACARAAETLGVAALRDADERMIEHADLDETDRRRARHVVREHARTLRAAACLEGGDIVGFGALTWESHASLRDDYEVSCGELDTVVAAARELSGPAGDVSGARLTGAGLGGCAIVFVRTAAVSAVATHLRDAFVRAHGRPAGAFVVRPSDGAFAQLVD